MIFLWNLRLELCIENLQGTLDSWEVDRDLLQQEVTQCKEQIMRRQAKMEEMSEELSMLHKNSASTKLEKDYIQVSFSPLYSYQS